MKYMKLIFQIAKNELKILFFSPVAWLMLVVFAAQTGMQFADLFNSLIRSFSLGYTSGGDITYNLYSNTFGGFFMRVQQYLYLYIPLLTMGIMSRETSSGSIKLLFSSPINNFQIVTEEFTPIYEAVKTIVEEDVKRIEKMLDEVGAPYTPGRLPIWK